MQELLPYFHTLLQFRTGQPVAVDHAHNLMIVGMVLAKKPERLLEIGIGSGFITASLVSAIRFNKRGRLTSVDNWADTRGREPKGIQAFRDQGVEIVVKGEEEFVRSAPTNSYDFLISDGDHFNSSTWLDQHLRIVTDGGFLFFHDTNQPLEFPGLATIESAVRSRGLACYHFKTSSRSDERCDRGLLFVINRK